MTWQALSGSPYPGGLPPLEVYPTSDGSARVEVELEVDEGRGAPRLPSMMSALPPHMSVQQMMFRRNSY
jgi:hypothetical protein